MALPQLKSTDNIINHYLFSTLKVGWIGVDMFFVLSGFLITGIIWKQKDKSAKDYFGNFYAKRFLRIFPVYYLYITLVFFVFIHLGDIGNTWHEKINQIPLFHYLIHIQNFSIASVDKWPGPMGITWSLAIEEHFYLIWPLLIFLLNKKWINRILIVILILSPIIRAYFNFHTHSHLSSYVITFCRLDALSFGSLIALNKDKLSVRYSIIALIISSFSIALIFFLKGKYYYHDTLVSTIGYSLNYILMGSILILIINNKFKILNHFFELKFLQKMGKYSYSIYLFHAPINGFFILLSHNINTNTNSINWSIIQLLYAVIIIFLSFLVGYISYNLFEKHFLKLKMRFNG